jgi:hypothetical protein
MIVTHDLAILVAGYSMLYPRHPNTDHMDGHTRCASPPPRGVDAVFARAAAAAGQCVGACELWLCGGRMKEGWRRVPYDGKTRRRDNFNG